jgi:hypothetical protein
VPEQGDVRAAERDERPRQTRRSPFDELAGPLGPTGCLRNTAEGKRVVGELNGESRGDVRVIARTREPVPALVGLDRSHAVQLVARGDAEPLLRLR